jgi:hypothetical protein
MATVATKPCLLCSTNNSFAQTLAVSQSSPILKLSPAKTQEKICILDSLTDVQRLSSAEIRWMGREDSQDTHVLHF